MLTELQTKLIDGQRLEGKDILKIIHDYAKDAAMMGLSLTYQDKKNKAGKVTQRAINLVPVHMTTRRDAQGKITRIGYGNVDYSGATNDTYGGNRTTSSTIFMLIKIAQYYDEKRKKERVNNVTMDYAPHGQGLSFDEFVNIIKNGQTFDKPVRLSVLSI